ncbi:TorD/DmsD family molecular chaperone [Hippea alviniae]|uniref:TorD/DmsD family molecular chaperone n=1 Tax=Hippea alviniae TaxID=1279027 RepID=UPI0003B35DD9|nr:molecular chaperone TorD family protein [Hippea alviniae]
MSELSEALGICADLLYYPEEEIKHEFARLFSLVGSTNKVDEILEGKSLSDLQSHYISMFDVKFGGVECVPYESWWSKKRLMGNEALNVEKFYERCGFRYNRDEFKMPPDHISIEIGFLSLLIEEKRFEEACKMVREHLGWVNKFYECVKDKSKIYGEILSILVNFLNKIKKGEVCLSES